MMTQTERRIFLIKELLSEQPRYRDRMIPAEESAQRQLLRSLMNLRPPMAVSEEFLQVQNDYLQTETAKKGVTHLSDLIPAEDGIYLWRGDITTLDVDAIVNAANSQMLGCFCPCHGCIDNAIHTFAGVQLRLACARLMQQQGHDEPTGSAKITPGYNLPCKFVLHTVGPIITGPLTKEDCDLLASCYRACLLLADREKLHSVAFCCISTGEFHFPNEMAAQIAVQTVKDYREQTKSKLEVIFNVFKQTDYDIYQALLGANHPSERGTQNG